MSETSQIQAPTPKNTYGFKFGSQEMTHVKAVSEVTGLLEFPSFISTFFLSDFARPLYVRCGSQSQLSKQILDFRTKP